MLARLVGDGVRPLAGVAVEWRPRQIERFAGSIGRGKYRVLRSVVRPRRRRRFGEEQQASKSELGDRGGTFHGCVKHACREAGAAESRTGWVQRAVSERREQQVMQMPALCRDRRLAVVDYLFEE